MMSDARRLPAKGPKLYDLRGMPDEEFERMCARLIRLEYPSAFKPANTADGGADMVLPGPGNTYERAWQAKHYPDRINWEKCKKSLATAKKGWMPRQYTFCFPRELTRTEQQTFDKHFRGAGEDLEVNYWNGEELLARLNGSDEAQRVARTFFEDPELDKENIARAIRAKGDLDTAEDALDRMLPVGGFLASRDAYFSYSGITHETDQPAPLPAPGTVISMSKIEGAITSRLDAVPRDEEALGRYGPEVRLETTPDEEGAHAAALLRTALEQGRSVRLTSGIDIVLTQAPPALEPLVGERLTGATVELGAPESPSPPTPPPFAARLQAKTDRGEAVLDVTLEAAKTTPPDWDGGLVGSYGGLEVALLFRERDGRGQIGWNFRYQTGDLPLLERVTALRMLRAITGTGELVVTDRGPTGRPETRVATQPRQLPNELLALIAYLEDLLVISEWTAVELEIPNRISGEAAYTTAVVANTIRNRGHSVQWSNLEVTVTAEGLGNLRTGGPLLIDRGIATRIGERVLDLGFTRLPITNYKVTQVVERKDGMYGVNLEPANEEAAQAFEELQNRQTTAKKPPPPPRRKRAKKPKGRRRRRR